MIPQRTSFCAPRVAAKQRGAIFRVPAPERIDMSETRRSPRLAFPVGYAGEGEEVEREVDSPCPGHAHGRLDLAEPEAALLAYQNATREARVMVQ